MYSIECFGGYIYKYITSKNVVKFEILFIGSATNILYTRIYSCIYVHLVVLTHLYNCPIDILVLVRVLVIRDKRVQSPKLK